MADITATATLNCSKGGQQANGTLTASLTLAGTHMLSDVQDIGTSYEIITLPVDLTSEGVTILWLRNLDPTNYVEIAIDSVGDGSGTKYPFAKIKAGGPPCLIPVYATAPVYSAKANTAGIQLSKVATGT